MDPNIWDTLCLCNHMLTEGTKQLKLFFKLNFYNIKQMEK